MPLPVPPAFEEALAEAPAARERFDRLPSEEKDAWIAWIGRRRSAGVRRRRIDEAVQRLAGAPPEDTLVAGGAMLAAPRDSAWWPWALALLLVVAGILAWQLADRNGGNGRASATPPPAAPAQQSVPDLVGQPLPAASAAVRAIGLRPVARHRISARPRGTVVEEKPVAGTPLRRGGRVTLVVSNGPPTKTVPSVVGLVAAAAQKELQARGFAPALAQRPSAKPPGTVLVQRPRAGAKAKLGSRVSLAVAKPKPKPAQTATTATLPATTAAAPPTTTASSAPSGVGVPSLAGKGLATALSSLEQAGLLAAVEYQSSQQPTGRVLGQNPASGARVAAGTRVRLDVAEGPNPGNPAQVPDVTGEDASTAQDDLQTAGFEVLVVHATRPGGRPGSVLDEQPAAGTTISLGDYVAIYVP